MSDKIDIEQMLAKSSGNKLGKKIDKEIKKNKEKFKLTDSIDILSQPTDKLEELQFIRMARENCLRYAELLKPKEGDEQDEKKFIEEVKAYIEEFFNRQEELVKTQGMNKYINGLDQYSRLNALINTEIAEDKYKQH